MQSAEYAEMLTERIDDLAAALEALRPDWQVPSLQQAYLASEVCRELLAVPVC